MTRKPKASAEVPKRFKLVKNSEWIQPTNEQFHHIRCCDCGLIHRMEFRLHRNRLQFRAWRVGTAKVRKRGKS